MRTWGEPRVEEKLYSHVDLIGLLDIVNTDAGSTVAGGRGYYLTREGALLNQALISFALGFGYARGYSPVQTPFFMNKDIMAECAQLSDFDEQLYKVTGARCAHVLCVLWSRARCVVWLCARALAGRLARLAKNDASHHQNAHTTNRAPNKKPTAAAAHRRHHRKKKARATTST